MSKIKNDGLDQYGSEPFEQQQFATADVEGVNVYSHVRVINEHKLTHLYEALMEMDSGYVEAELFRKLSLVADVETLSHHSKPPIKATNPAAPATQSYAYTCPGNSHIASSMYSYIQYYASI